MLECQGMYPSPLHLPSSLPQSSSPTKQAYNGKHQLCSVLYFHCTALSPWSENYSQRGRGGAWGIINIREKMPKNACGRGLLRPAFSSIPRTRQRLRSFEESNTKAVPQFERWALTLCAVKMQKFSEKCLVPYHYTLHLMYIALGGTCWAWACSTSPAYLCYIAPSNRMGSCHVHSTNLMCALVNSFLSVLCDQAIDLRNAGSNPVANWYR